MIPHHPKSSSLDEAADDYATDTGKTGMEHREVFNHFKAGAAYQAGVEEKRAQVSVEALEFIANDLDMIGIIPRTLLAKYLSKTFITG